MRRPDHAPRDRWISEEWRLVRAARRALARAGRRPGRLLAWVLLVTGVMVAVRALQPPRYEASLSFRLAEGDLSDPRASPRPPRDVRNYVSNVALSRHQLKQVMLHHGRSAAWLARDPVAAIDDLRDDISIEVSRNYFLHERGGQDEPRTAQVTVALSGGDAEQTGAMLHEIGQVILQGQVAQRRGRLTEAHDLLAKELTAARARSRSIQESLERLSAQAMTAPRSDRTRLATRLAAQEDEARSAIDQVLQLERRLAAVDFSGAAEEERLGLNLQLVDERLVTVVPPLTPAALALHGLVAFLVALLLVSPVVGAFDDRLHGAEDLAELGLGLVGVFPRFAGDQVGAGRGRGLLAGSREGKR